MNVFPLSLKKNEKNGFGNDNETLTYTLLSHLCLIFYEERSIATKLMSPTLINLSNTGE